MDLFARYRVGSTPLAHLCCMNLPDALAAGLEPLLTTADLGVKPKAIYDLRATGLRPRAIRVWHGCCGGGA